jgi:tRNA nucleotidyltransferase (CCA-adding enzyme)
MPSDYWEHFEHQADIGVRGHGRSLAAAFEQAALAMTAVITDPSGVLPQQRVDLSCQGDDPEYLLVDWLNQLVYEMATRHMLFSRFRVSIDNGHLHGSAWGEMIDVARHQPVVEIKGATLTELLVREHGGNWLAQCVVDV